MTLTDVADWYLDDQGNLSRWQRKQTSGPTEPGAPTNAQATLSSGTATVTWAPPSKDGGSAITGYTVTREGGATHPKLATDRSDTFTGLGAGPYSFDIAAVNIVGPGPIAVASTSSTAYRFPGDTLPLKTGNILFGATENDNDGTKLTVSNEYSAPEADTGLKYSIIKTYYTGGNVEDCFIPITGGIARDAKLHWGKGHIILANIAIQKSTNTHFTTWRKAGTYSDSVVYNTYYNFIQYCEEGSDAPSCPIWLCMPHEAQQASGKVDLNPANGMTPGDYGDMQWCFRRVMNDYATAKAGSPSAYKWKRLAFGSLATGDAFGVSPSASNYAWKAIENYYTSFSGGGTPYTPGAIHDWIGSDPYQVPIEGDLPSGRTGHTMWTANAQAMVAYCKAHNVPAVFGEWGIRQADGDAADQMISFWNQVTNGTHDIVALVYFNSGAGGTIAAGNTHWLLTDHWDNNPANPINSLNFKDSHGNKLGMLSCFELIMRKSNVKRFWDLGSPGIPGGYTKPPGV